MNSRKKNSHFNFYESFSDLIFCTLILFLVIVLFLVLQINQKTQEVQKESEHIRVKKEFVSAAIDRVAQKEKEVSDLLGTSQFINYSSPTKIWMAVDISVSPPLFYFIDANAATSFYTNYSGHLRVPKSIRSAALGIIEKNIATGPGLTQQQVAKAVGALQPHLSNQPSLGIKLEDDKSQVVIKEVQSDLAKKSGIRKGDILLEIEGRAIAGARDANVLISLIKHVRKVKLKLNHLGQTLDVKVPVIPFSRGDVYWGVNVDEINAFVSGLRDINGDPTSSIDKVIAGEEKASLLFSGWKVGSSEHTTTCVQAIDDYVLRGKISEDFLRLQLVPILMCDVDLAGISITLNGVVFTPEQIRVVASSIGGRGLILNFSGLDSSSEQIPKWLKTRVLDPAGFVTRAPNLPLMIETE